jgi:hypothetical protein
VETVAWKCLSSAQTAPSIISGKRWQATGGPVGFRMATPKPRYRRETFAEVE